MHTRTTMTMEKRSSQLISPMMFTKTLSAFVYPSTRSLIATRPNSRRHTGQFNTGSPSMQITRRSWSARRLEQASSWQRSHVEASFRSLVRVFRSVLSVGGGNGRGGVVVDCSPASRVCGVNGPNQQYFYLSSRRSGRLSASTHCTETTRREPRLPA